jgi:small subunit ribosomal protein S9
MTEISEKKEKKDDLVRAIGRRKNASARVRISLKKNGGIVVNNKPMNDYFNTPVLQKIILTPLQAVGKEDAFEISVRVVGGGIKGQAGAVSHGIARALLKWNEEWRKSLKTLGLLTRDPRKKERKKPGLKKARKAPQWSKR